MRGCQFRSWRMWGGALLRLLVVLGLTHAALACRSGANTDASAGAPVVTVYVSTDRVFAEPVLQEYQRRSGVLVNAVYDTEETKSTGLANRLIAERTRPQADVFWSNEPVRTLVLKSRHVLAPYRGPQAAGLPDALVDPEGYWTGFSARIRVIAYNTKLVKPEDAPKSVFDLADPRWKGEIAIADPRFGSTSFHVAAIYALLGDEKADDFFRRLKANGVRIVDGNSVVRDLVAKGEVKAGLTDTDDVNVAIEGGKPIAMVLPDKDGLGVPVMPNMVSLIANAPHPEQGRKLIDYLLSADVERMLAASEAVQIPLRQGVPGPKNMPSIDSFKPMMLDYAKAASRVEDATGRLATILGL
jgi:iron(III) transport system substrate-binding protein